MSFFFKVKSGVYTKSMVINAQCQNAFLHAGVKTFSLLSAFADPNFHSKIEMKMSMSSLGFSSVVLRCSRT